MSANITWIGHRGYPELYPENSLRGIEAALKLGAKAIEMDLQASRDGEPVLFHDEDLQRLTGRQGLVKDHPWAQLQTMSAHEPNRFGEQFLPTPIAHLQELVELMQQYPDAQLFVELKADIFTHIPRLEFLATVCKILQPIAERCVIISFDLPVLRLAQQTHGCRVGWVLTHYDAASRACVEGEPVDFMICNIRKLLPERPWPGPWQWFVYDVVDDDNTQACVERGIVWIETWNIGAMLKNPRWQR